MTGLPDAVLKDTVSALAIRLAELLRREIARIFSSTDRITISFSGGLDSTLLARLSQEFGTFDCAVAGLPGCTDIKNAERAARMLGIPLRKVELTEASVTADIRHIVDLSGTTDPIFVSFEIPLIAILREVDSEIVMTGQGADELFGGYSKYFGLEASEFANLRSSDIQRLSQVTIPLEDKIVRDMKKRIERPYISESIVSFASSLNPDLLMPGKGSKRLIREALVYLGLENIAELPKKAAQYGSGSMRIMKMIARAKGVSVKGLIEQLMVSAR